MESLRVLTSITWVALVIGSLISLSSLGWLARSYGKKPFIAMMVGVGFIIVAIVLMMVQISLMSR